MSIGSRLSVLAKSAGLTQEEIATRLQISRITINRYFKGRTEIRSGDLVKLLGLFGIDIAALLDGRIEELLKGKASGNSGVSHSDETAQKNYKSRAANESAIWAPG